MKRALALLLLVSLGLVSLGCKTTPEPEPEPPSPFPAWVGRVEVVPDPLLEEAARQLCARGQSVVDDALKTELGLIDGQLATLKDGTGEALAALLKARKATHLGAVSANGCRAAVLARRLVAPQGEVPVQRAAPGALELKLALLEGDKPTLFVSQPDGSVERAALAVEGGSLKLPLALKSVGRYRAEVLVEVPGEGPVVAALWPITVGEPKGLPPAPEVLFPDEGHSDLALGLRLAALVHRLRTEQELYPFKTAPLLDELARERVARVAEEKTLGHLLPDEKGAHEALLAKKPDWKVARLSELQAQASTLQDAWSALLRSPAHRYELVWPESTHVGAAVSHGTDAAGQPQLSLVLLLARKVSEISRADARGRLTAKLNLARDQAGRGPLRTYEALERIAQAQAEAMAKGGTTDDGLLGRPVAELALDDDSSLKVVRSVLAVVDDPMRIPASRGTLAKEADKVGIGVVDGATAGRWYVCVLAGQ